MTTVDPQVRQLIQSLKKETALPPHIMSAVQEITKQDSQATNKAMHSAVTKIGAARKALHQAQEARITMHSAWRAFLAEATARWDGYGKEFEEDDGKLQADIAKAREDLVNAKKHFDAMKIEAGTGADAMVDLDSDTEEAPDKSAMQIQEGLSAMRASLKNVKEQAEAMDVAENARKKARTGSNVVVEPFPKADS